MVAYATPDSQKKQYEGRKRPEKSIADYMDDEFKAGRREGKRAVQRIDEERVARARRGAFSAGQANARKAQKDAATVSRETSSSPTVAPADDYAPELSAPDLAVPGVSSLGIGSGGPDKGTSARIIVIVTTIAAIGTVAHDAIVGGTPQKTTVKVGNGTVTVPTHLRTLGAVLIMGTIALVVNEVDPGVGLVLGIALGLDVAANTFLGTDGLFARLQSGIFGAGGATPNAKPLTNAPASGTSPSSQSMIAWILAHPGQLPNPNAGPNDFWNTYARNTAADANK